MARSREPLHGGSQHVFADPVFGADDYTAPAGDWLQAGCASPVQTARLESVEILSDVAIAQAVDFIWPADTFENVHALALPESNGVSFDDECSGDESHKRANG